MFDYRPHELFENWLIRVVMPWAGPAVWLIGVLGGPIVLLLKFVFHLPL